MVGTATDSLVLIELDFDPDFACEHPEHDGPESAAWVETGRCPVCRVQSRLLLCSPCVGYANAAKSIEHESGCGAITPAPQWNLTYTPIKEVR